MPPRPLELVRAKLPALCSAPPELLRRELPKLPRGAAAAASPSSEEPGSATAAPRRTALHSLAPSLSSSSSVLGRPPMDRLLSRDASKRATSWRCGTLSGSSTNLPSVAPCAAPPPPAAFEARSNATATVLPPRISSWKVATKAQATGSKSAPEALATATTCRAPWLRKARATLSQPMPESERTVQTCYNVIYYYII